MTKVTRAESLTQRLGHWGTTVKSGSSDGHAAATAWFHQDVPLGVRHSGKSQCGREVGHGSPSTWVSQQHKDRAQGQGPGFPTRFSLNCYVTLDESYDPPEPQLLLGLDPDRFSSVPSMVSWVGCVIPLGPEEKVTAVQPLPPWMTAMGSLGGETRARHGGAALVPEVPCICVRLLWDIRTGGGRRGGSRTWPAVWAEIATCTKKMKGMYLCLSASYLLFSQRWVGLGLSRFSSVSERRVEG